MNLEKLYCDIDDFVKSIPQNQLQITKQNSKRGGRARMNLTELMTIAVLYHSSQYKNFKHFYFYLCTHHKKDFSKILSYTRFLDWMPYLLIPLTQFLQSKMAICDGKSYIDSTPISVCKNIRISRNKVFGTLAQRGKSSTGWFFGLKLHLVVNTVGDILSFCLTGGNIDDRSPVIKLAQKIKGKLYGDRGYVGAKLFEELFAMDVELITNIKSNMKNKLVDYHDKLMLRKRFIIETIIDQLKNVSDIEHSRHRSPINFLVNIVAGLVSYTYQEKKPSIKWLNSLELKA